MKIYHNPRCKHSRAGLEYLKTKTSDFEIIDYIKDSLTEGELANILMLLDKRAEDVIRTQEDIYRKELKDKNFTEEEWIKIIVQNPRLLHRPIIMNRTKAVIAQPPERLDELL